MFLVHLLFISFVILSMLFYLSTAKTAFWSASHPRLCCCLFWIGQLQAIFWWRWNVGILIPIGCSASKPLWLSLYFFKRNENSFVIWVSLFWYFLSCYCARSSYFKKWCLQLWCGSAWNVDRPKINGQKPPKWGTQSRGVGKAASRWEKKVLPADRPPARRSLLNKRCPENCTVGNSLP